MKTINTNLNFALSINSFKVVCSSFFFMHPSQNFECLHKSRSSTVGCKIREIMTSALWYPYSAFFKILFRSVKELPTWFPDSGKYCIEVTRSETWRDSDGPVRLEWCNHNVSVQLPFGEFLILYYYEVIKGSVHSQSNCNKPSKTEKKLKTGVLRISYK
jgi:hypothetical protein